MSDTICAVSTAPGTGGIAVIRISGSSALSAVAPLWKGKSLFDVKTHTAHLGDICDPLTGELIDRGVATVFRAPHSYTGEDTVELSVHGSRWIQEELVKQLIRQGARLAEPGEFTRRAFTAGRLDLTQVDAVADLIAARSRAAHRIATSQMKGSFSRRLAELRHSLVELASLLELELDFSDQEVEFASRQRLRDIARQIHDEIDRLCKSFDRGQAIAEGIPVAIVGDTNAGKSTLLNRLVDNDRAIVSEHRGTTRDTIEETATIGDIMFRFIDTAGIRITDDPVEAMGIERSRQALLRARIILWVIDSTMTDQEITHTFNQIFDGIDLNSKTLIAVANKRDLTRRTIRLPYGEETVRTIDIAAATGEGIDSLKDEIIRLSGISDAADDITVTNLRHYQALDRARTAISRVISDLDTEEYGVFVAQSLREVIDCLGEITGTVTDTEILATIFSRFCIGK